jgi:preprotein translocase subunit SecG
MYGFLLTVLVLDGLFLSVVILLQAGKGGGLAAMGGGASATEGILGGRQATTVLTRATWISGTAFMVLALVLAILSSRSETATPVLRQNLPAGVTPAPVLPETAPPVSPVPVTPPAGETPPPGGGDGEGLS